jgi:hypothetical protein
MSISDLVDNIDETGWCDRLFGQVIVTSYLYRLGAWLMHLFMVQVDVWYILAHVIGIGCYMLFGAD